MNRRQSLELFLSLYVTFELLCQRSCTVRLCVDRLCSDNRPNRPKQAPCWPNIIFHLGVWRGGALLFVCVMYQCVISDRGSVCCAVMSAIDLLSDSSFCSADRQWWRAASGRHWLQTSDTLSHAHRVYWSALDGRLETKTHTHTRQCRFRAGSTPLNWANLEWTQAQLKTSQLTESNSLYILLSMLYCCIWSLFKSLWSPGHPTRQRFTPTWFEVHFFFLLLCFCVFVARIHVCKKQVNLVSQLSLFNE